MSTGAAEGGAGRITLLSDFGTRDGYAATMRGVIAAIAPRVIIEDATHDVTPGDVAGGAWALGSYWRYFPAGTVHVAVVDPGVGSDRRALAAAVDGHFFVAPDNGLLTYVLRERPAARVVSIENAAYVRETISATFHGRDIFAPAAAHLALGVSLDQLGPVVPNALLLPELIPTRSGDIIRGQIVHIDRFGNLITNVPGEWISPQAKVRFGAIDLGVVRRTYSEAQSGHAVAVVGSAGFLEIGVRDGEAARVLWKGKGTIVVVEG